MLVTLRTILDSEKGHMFLFFLFLGSLSYFSASGDDAILYVRKAFAYAILKLPNVGDHAPAAGTHGAGKSTSLSIVPPRILAWKRATF